MKEYFQGGQRLNELCGVICTLCDLSLLVSDLLGIGHHHFGRFSLGITIYCAHALILYRVMRMRLQASKRSESPCTLLEQLKRIHQQTVQTPEGQTLTGLTEMTPAQKSSFAALDLTPPTPSDLAQPVL
jgi:hypothetical protein